MSDARWERLAVTLADVVDAEVDRFGEARHITLRINPDLLIVVSDTWWHDHWTGWQVYTEGADGITRRTYPRTKKRGEVRRHVIDALPAEQEAGRS